MAACACPAEGAVAMVGVGVPRSHYEALVRKMVRQSFLTSRPSVSVPKELFGRRHPLYPSLPDHTPPFQLAHSAFSSYSVCPSSVVDSPSLLLLTTGRGPCEV
jgi:hypothetical protein